VSEVVQSDSPGDSRRGDSRLPYTLAKPLPRQIPLPDRAHVIDRRRAVLPDGTARRSIARVHLPTQHSP